jgi:hypothetical protein
VYGLVTSTLTSLGDSRCEPPRHGGWAYGAGREKCTSMAIEANFVAESDQKEQINDIITLFEHEMSHEPYVGTSRHPQSWHMAHGTWFGSSSGLTGERMLFIGTQLSNLYTAVHTPTRLTRIHLGPGLSHPTRVALTSLSLSLYRPQ